MNRFSLAALIGPSGVGKSSFLRAGVMAARPEGWSVVMCTPGNAPFTSLAEACCPSSWAKRMSCRSSSACRMSREASRSSADGDRRNRQALLIVDQFEELFTLNPPEVQSRFAEASRAPPRWRRTFMCSSSMRDDFFFLLSFNTLPFARYSRPQCPSVPFRRRGSPPSDRGAGTSLRLLRSRTMLSSMR